MELKQIRKIAEKFGLIQEFVPSPYGVNIIIKRFHINFITLHNIKKHGFEFVSVYHDKEGITLNIYYPIMEKQ